MRTLLLSSLLFAAAGLAACQPESATTYRNALTGDKCTPNGTLQPPTKGNGNGNGGHNSPTGIPGDNMDDLHSGKVDCYYDGNSGQGKTRSTRASPAATTSTAASTTASTPALAVVAAAAVAAAAPVTAASSASPTPISAARPTRADRRRALGGARYK